MLTDVYKHLKCTIINIKRTKTFFKHNIINTVSSGSAWPNVPPQSYSFALIVLKLINWINMIKHYIRNCDWSCVQCPNNGIRPDWGPDRNYVTTINILGSRYESSQADVLADLLLYRLDRELMSAGTLNFRNWSISIRSTLVYATRANIFTRLVYFNGFIWVRQYFYH